MHHALTDGTEGEQNPHASDSTSTDTGEIRRTNEGNGGSLK